METENELLAMMMLHQAVNIPINTIELHDLYLYFYNKTINKNLLTKSINDLAEKKLLNVNKNLITLSEKGMIKGSKKYIEYYFTEGVIRAESSKTDKKYQDLKNIGTINSDSIIDDVQLKYIANQLKNYKNTIYDLGCGRGDIVSYIQNENSCSCIGIDKSESMIKISQSKNSKISWIVADIEKYCKHISNCDAAILIDSIYFIKDKKTFINELYSKINSGGKIVITYSNYTEDLQKEQVLKPDLNEVGKILNHFGWDFEYTEFTKNEIALWEHRMKITENLKDDYIKEHNSFLYYDRMSESSDLLRVLKLNLGRRFIYTVTKK